MSYNRDKEKMQKRSEHVKAVVSKTPSVSKAIKKLAKELFLSERTIYRDLEK